MATGNDPDHIDPPAYEIVALKNKYPWVLPSGQLLPDVGSQPQSPAQPMKIIRIQSSKAAKDQLAHRLLRYMCDGDKDLELQRHVTARLAIDQKFKRNRRRDQV
jgi:hypothetical protein